MMDAIEKTRRPWQAPTLKSIGTISELLQSGTGGKPSVSTADPGEPRKTKNAAN